MRRSRLCAISLKMTEICQDRTRSRRLRKHHTEAVWMQIVITIIPSQRLWNGVFRVSSASEISSMRRRIPIIRRAILPCCLKRMRRSHRSRQAILLTLMRNRLRSTRALRWTDPFISGTSEGITTTLRTEKRAVRSSSIWTGPSS